MSSTATTIVNIIIDPTIEPEAQGTGRNGSRSTRTHSNNSSLAQQGQDKDQLTATARAKSVCRLKKCFTRNRILAGTACDSQTKDCDVAIDIKDDASIASQRHNNMTRGNYTTKRGGSARTEK